MTQIYGSPNAAVADRIIDLMKDPAASSRSPEDWARLRRPAFENDDMLEATAITCAQYKVAMGTLEPVDARVLVLLAQPGSLSRTPEQWRDLRSQAWTRNDLKEVAALTYTYMLLHYKPRFRAEH